MRKKYEVSRVLAANERVFIRLEFPDAATEGATVISRYDGKFYEISRGSKVDLGRARELAADFIKMTSIIFNMDKKVDKVRMNVCLNDEIIVAHENLKTDGEHPTIKIRLRIEVS